MLYAAYGTEVKKDFMSCLCPNAKLFGSGRINGYRLVFEHTPNIIPDGKSYVPVLVWDVSESDVERLDRYYDYPMYYESSVIDVDINGEDIAAFTYMLNKSTVDLECPYSVAEDVIYEGYIENGFDIGYLKDAIEESYYESVK